MSEKKFLQLVFVFETNDKVLVDQTYVNEVLRRFYIDTPYIVHNRPICLNGKTHYNDKKVHNQITNRKREFKANGMTEAVFFFDSDDEAGPLAHSQRNKNIAAYCQEKGYHLVWFVKDIEQVHWGRPASEEESKSDLAETFKATDEVFRVPEYRLAKKNPTKGESNILIVLDQFFKRR